MRGKGRPHQGHRLQPANAAARRYIWRRRESEMSNRSRARRGNGPARPPYVAQVGPVRPQRPGEAERRDAFFGGWRDPIIRSAAPCMFERTETAETTHKGLTPFLGFGPRPLIPAVKGWPLCRLSSKHELHRRILRRIAAGANTFKGAYLQAAESGGHPFCRRLMGGPAARFRQRSSKHGCFVSGVARVVILVDRDDIKGWRLKI